MLHPPLWSEFKGSYPVRMPLTLHRGDARFYEYDLDGKKGQKCSKICCDCEGCLQNEELEAVLGEARLHMENENWQAVADILVDRCCSVRKALFPDQEPVFFERTDGHWRKEAWWCGGGRLRHEAWKEGLVDGHWYCHPCLAKTTGLPDVTPLRNEWVEYKKDWAKAL